MCDRAFILAFPAQFLPLGARNVAPHHSGGVSTCLIQPPALLRKIRAGEGSFLDALLPTFTANPLDA